MDDPIFDPWSADAEESAPESAPAPTSRRWRSPVRTGPGVPLAPFVERSQGPVPDARLPGTAGFLRTMAVPTLEDVARRLRVARHSATVLDRLAESRAVVRLSLRPWQGPPSGDPAAPIALLELSLEAGDEHLVAHMWWDSDSAPSATELSRIPVVELEAAWLEGLAAGFVSRVLARA